MDFEFSMDFTDDPGEELSKKTFAIFSNQPKDEHGRPMKLTYNEAFSQAQLENPELTRRYIEQLFGRS